MPVEDQISSTSELNQYLSIAGLSKTHGLSGGSDYAHSTSTEAEIFDSVLREAKRCFHPLQQVLNKHSYRSSSTAAVFDAAKSLRRLTHHVLGRKALIAVAGLMECVVSVLEMTIENLLKRIDETHKNSHDAISVMWNELFSALTESLKNIALSQTLAEKKCAVDSGVIPAFIRILESSAVDKEIRLASCAAIRGLSTISEFRTEMVENGAVLCLLSAFSDDVDFHFEGVMALVLLLDSDLAKAQALTDGIEMLHDMISQQSNSTVQLMSAACVIIILDGKREAFDKITQICGPNVIVKTANIVLSAAENGLVNLSSSGAFHKLMSLIYSVGQMRTEEEVGQTKVPECQNSIEDSIQAFQKAKVVERFRALNNHDNVQHKEKGISDNLMMSSSVSGESLQPAIASITTTIEDTAALFCSQQVPKDLSGRSPRPFGWKFRGAYLTDIVKKTPRSTSEGDLMIKQGNHLVENMNSPDADTRDSDNLQPLNDDCLDILFNYLQPSGGNPDDIIKYAQSYSESIRASCLMQEEYPHARGKNATVHKCWQYQTLEDHEVAGACLDGKNQEPPSVYRPYFKGSRPLMTKEPSFIRPIGHPGTFSTRFSSRSPLHDEKRAHMNLSTSVFRDNAVGFSFNKQGIDDRSQNTSKSRQISGALGQSQHYHAAKTSQEAQQATGNPEPGYLQQNADRTTESPYMDMLKGANLCWEKTLGQHEQALFGVSSTDIVHMGRYSRTPYSVPVDNYSPSKLPETVHKWTSCDYEVPTTPSADAPNSSPMHQQTNSPTTTTVIDLRDTRLLRVSSPKAAMDCARPSSKGRSQHPYRNRPRKDSAEMIDLKAIGTHGVPFLALASRSEKLTPLRKVCSAPGFSRPRSKPGSPIPTIPAPARLGSHVPSMPSADLANAPPHYFGAHIIPSPLSNRPKERRASSQTPRLDARPVVVGNAVMPKREKQPDREEKISGWGDGSQGYILEAGFIPVQP